LPATHDLTASHDLINAVYVVEAAVLGSGQRSLSGSQLAASTPNPEISTGGVEEIVLAHQYDEPLK
jgi:hypothetical protein